MPDPVESLEAFVARMTDQSRQSAVYMAPTQIDMLRKRERAIIEHERARHREQLTKILERIDVALQELSGAGNDLEEASTGKPATGERPKVSDV